MELFEKLSGRTWLLLVGICSAFVGLVIHTEIKTFRQRLAFMAGGTFCCLFCTGPVTRYLNVTDPDYVSLTGFLLGIFGMSLLQRIKAYVDSLDIIAVIKSRMFPGAKP